MSNNSQNKGNIRDHIIEIREACVVATSMDDTNLNAIIEEIERLANSILIEIEK